MRPANNNILSFEIPKKLRSADKHNEMFLSDSGIAGTYVPNMSNEDMNLWKAKHIKGDDERIEIRKTLDGVQLLIVIYKKSKVVKWNKGNCNHDEYNKKHGNVRMSMNGKLDMSMDDYWDLTEVVKEALEILL
ncbi:MAG: hypothetical protein WC428_02725 [Candidatus Paceibacterota bacterium]